MYLGFPKNTKCRIKEKKKESETDNNKYMYMCLFDFFVFHIHTCIFKKWINIQPSPLFFPPHHIPFKSFLDLRLIGICNISGYQSNETVKRKGQGKPKGKERKKDGKHEEPRKRLKNMSASVWSGDSHNCCIRLCLNKTKNVIIHQCLTVEKVTYYSKKLYAFKFDVS